MSSAPNKRRRNRPLKGERERVTAELLVRRSSAAQATHQHPLTREPVKT